MKKILLHSKKNGNHWSLVDDVDYERVKEKRWNAKLHHHKIIGIGRWWNKKNKCYETGILARYIMNAKPGQIVDHINNNSLDNQRSNLRFVTPFQNTVNRNKYPRNGKMTSQYKGVVKCEHYGKRKHSTYYLSYIRTHGELKYLGYFENEIEAAKAYDAASVKYHGEYGRRNFDGL